LTDALAKNKTKFDSIVAHGVAFLTAVANGAHHALFSNGEIMVETKKTKERKSNPILETEKHLREDCDSLHAIAQERCGGF